ncbi:MAG: hypothetical protein ACTSWJ_10975 [Candidatus Heimdallarchaeaceae archaeon]
MRDSKRIEPMLNNIKRIWQTYPDLRLLQLLLNCLTTEEEGMAYYFEDDKLAERLDNQYQKYQEVDKP